MLLLAADMQMRKTWSKKLTSLPSTRRLLATFAAFICLIIPFAGPAAADDRPSEKPSGRITIRQTQVAFVASGSFGGGTLSFKGKSYRFKIGGLGVGGFGASSFNASGEVFGLANVSQFPGAYAELRTGWALGDKGRGRVWLRNANGVLISLKGSREGLQLASGASGVVISMQ
jgi:hypothetical protein